MYIQRYLLSLPPPFFIPAINPSKPEIIPWTLGPHSPTECPRGQRQTLRASLMRRSTRVGTSVSSQYMSRGTYCDVNITMDVNNRHHGGSNYRCQTCTFRIRRFHNGPCAVGVSFLTSFSQWQKPENFYLCTVTAIETTNRISNYFCFQNHFNIGICGNPIQICRNILQQIILWVVLKIQSIFSWRFLNAQQCWISMFHPM